MGRKYNYLTKSKVTSGLQCHKKLWFDVHEPLKREKAIFYGGNRFGNQVIKNYSKKKLNILDLTGDFIKPVEKTTQAINSNKIDIIFEAAFEFSNTQVRTDVLIKQKDGWTLLEAKSSTKLKPEHIDDISIQSYVVRQSLNKLGQKLKKVKLIHINTKFILKKIGDYEGLINDDNDLTERLNENEIPNNIEELLPLTNKDSVCPKISIGSHCNKPYSCDYFERCETVSNLKQITPFTILPYIGKSKDLIDYMVAKKTSDLQKVPKSFFKDRKDYAPGYHQIIQTAHKKNQPWINPNLKNVLKDFEFPMYFMDFETIGQVVPIIKGTTPYYPLPFQWSVHKWSTKDKPVDSGKSFLQFDDQDIERKFIETLIKAVGDKGTIFAHNAKGTEIKILEKLKEKDNCKDFISQINNIIKRVEDSATIAKHNFYSPLMNGDWGIKSIVKAIPGCTINYEEEGNISGGTDAQLAWFINTDPNETKDRKEKQKKLLLEYCSKDTLAIYYLIKYLIEL